jgi:hypothetical protein
MWDELQPECWRTKHAQDKGDEEKRWNVTDEVTAVQWVKACLYGHDRPMNDARPDRKCYEADMPLGPAGGDQEKYPERGIQGDDHFEVFGPTMMPCPPCRPKDREGVHRYKEGEAKGKQRGAEVFVPGAGIHERFSTWAVSKFKFIASDVIDFEVIEDLGGRSESEILTRSVVQGLLNGGQLLVAEL